MGDKAEDIFSTFELAPDEAKKFSIVMDRFEKYFIPRRNVIYERARFNTRVQEEGESAEDFATALHALSQHCEYGSLQEQLVRDRLVVGIRDKKLSARLQLDPDLTLQKALESARQLETVRQQQAELHPDLPTVNKVGATRRAQRQDTRKPPSDSSQGRPTANTSQAPRPCRWCGRGSHSRSTCPAKDAKCNSCHKKGHFSSVCLSKRVDIVQGADQESECAFLGTVSSPGIHNWEATIMVQGQPLKFKIDTGADETVLSPEAFERLQHRPTLAKSQRKLHGPDGRSLSVRGVARLQLAFRDQQTTEDVYVLEEVRCPLLGKPAIEKLQLITCLNYVSHTVNPKKEFPSLFTGLGTLPGKYVIRLQDGATPFALCSPRRIPIPVYEKTKKELERMEQTGVISRADEPTQWCAPMVPVVKPTGAIRVCVDFTELNRFVLREWHPIPSVEHTLGLLSGARIFSKLDANSGFWQIKLAESSRKLTTFITPFGRFHFNRLPFGIASAPEIFQRQMNTILEGIPRVFCHMDDILVWGATTEEHNDTLRAVLQRLAHAGVTLNEAKCVFNVRELIYLGHKIDQEGIRPDEAKIKAITEMKAPTNRTELQRVLGMATYLARFVPNLAEVLQPLTLLLSKKQEFVWDSYQQTAFDKWKQLLTTSPVLAVYDPAKETVVTADASSFGVGAVLRQQQAKGNYAVIAYASRLLTDTERRYAQIEKEALALVWACEKFADYLVGKQFRLESDHKPLIPIFTSKALDGLTPRLQRLRMRMMRYSYDITYVPGKELLAADALSRAPLTATDPWDLAEEVETFVRFVTSSVPIKVPCLQWLKECQQEDSLCTQLRRFCSKQWPPRRDLCPEAKQFFQFRHELFHEDDILWYGTRVVVPHSCRPAILRLLHEGHFGITKTLAKATETVWWPGISRDIEDVVKRCHKCAETTLNRKMPLKPTPFPERPWQRIAMDLYFQHNKWWLIITDYYSRYPEIARLDQLSAATVITHCKSIFARHGIPEVVVTDNGPQFSRVSRSEFATFARDYGFQHVTSSPHYPQSNGMAESAVKIIKASTSKTRDVYTTLLAYRTTPLKNGYSPAQLLMGRRLRTKLPMASKLLVPELPDVQTVQKFEQADKERQRKAYDRRHGTRDLPDLFDGDDVWIADLKKKGTVVQAAAEPRSYIVDTKDGVVRRNRTHLVPLPQDDPGSTHEAQGTSLQDGTTREEGATRCQDTSHSHSRCGRCVIRPKKYTA